MLPEIVADFFSDVYHFFFDRYRNAKYGIINLFHWFPVIWKDRDFDYHYLLVMLNKKLHLMRDTFQSELDWVDNKQIISEIEETISSLEKIIEDKYCESEWEEVHKNRGELKFEKTADGYYTMIDNLTEEEKKIYTDKVKELMNKEEELRNKDLETVFENMKSKIMGWWS